MPDSLPRSLDNRGIALLALIAWIAAVVGAAYLPGARLWGVNLLAFASTEVRIGFALLALLAIYWTAFGAQIPRLSWRPAPIIAASGVMILFVICAWLLRAREALLGDGTLRASDAMKLTAVLPSEILPTALATALVHALPGDFSVDGFQAYRIVSISSAACLATFLWWFVQRATGHHNRSILLWLLTFGTVRMLTGYVETYTPALAFYACWTFAAWGYMHRRVGPAWLIGFWSLAMLSHVTAVLLIPASLWVLATDGHGVIRLGRRPVLGFVAISFVIGGAIVAAFYRSQVENIGTGAGHFFITVLSGPPSFYGLLSWAHMADFLNHWLLLAPAFVVLGSLSLWTYILEIKQGHGKWISTDSIFWSLAAGLPLAAGFLIDPKLGWARDWDLFALLSIPALIGCAMWLNRLTGSLRRSAIGIALLSAGLWLTFSVDGNAERRRFEALLDLDPSRSDYGHEILAQYYHRIGDFEGTLRNYRAALNVSENLRYRVNIAIAYYSLGRYDEAEQWSRGVIARDSTNAPAQHGLSLVLSETGRAPEALIHSARAVSLDPARLEYAMQYALVLVQLRRYAEAIPFLRVIAHVSPKEAAPLNALTVSYLGLDSIAEAEVTSQKALRLAPEQPAMWLNAACAAFRGQSWVEAKQYLEEYQKRLASNAPDSVAQAMLDSLGRMAGKF